MLENSVTCAIYLFLIYLPIADGATTPSNTAVVAGNWMAMECRPDNGWQVITWEKRQNMSSGFSPIFKNHDGILGLTGQYSSRFGTDMDETCSGLLYTNATQLDDAGLYVCHFERSAEPTEQLEFFSAHLIVLESDPFCETNYTVEVNETFTEGDIIWMQCLVNFRGMWAPTVEWKLHTVNGKEEEQTIIREASTVTLVNTRVTTTLNYVYTFSETTYFSCRMHFQRYNGSLHATATNLPEFTYTWKSPKWVSHRGQLKTTEEVYIALLPVEVGPLSTTIIIPVGNSAWYLIALTLLAAVVIFVTLLAGLGIRRYVRFRRARDINMIYNASTSSTVPLRRLDRPSSGEYDLTPTATHNIYDRIDGADGGDDVTGQAMASHDQCHPQLTQCYSGLMAAIETCSSPYDTLDLYEKMDPLNSETDTAGSRATEGSIQVSNEERYTTPVPKSGPTKSSNPGSSDYLEMVGSKRNPTTKVPAKLFVAQNDSDEDTCNYPDFKAKAYAKDYDDDLQPGSKALDN